MPVAIQQPPKRKRDLIDVMLAGLQGASAFVSIKKGMKELEEIPKVKEDKQAKEKRESDKLIFDQEAKLRDSWLKSPQTQLTQNVYNSIGKISSIATGKPSPAGDLSLLYSYMQLLDPGSTVREGEQAMASNAGRIDDKIRNIYNKVLSGETLTPSQRADFANRAVQLYDVHWQKQKAFNQAFETLAVDNKLNPKNVVMELAIDPAEFNKVIEGYIRENNLIPESKPSPILPKVKSPKPFDVNKYLGGK